MKPVTAVRRIAFLPVLALGGLLLLALRGETVWGKPGAYPHIEASFSLSGITGNPFDYTANDVEVTFRGPRGADKTIPAFFDGGTTWRVRFTPLVAGRYTLASVTRNGASVTPEGLSSKTFSASGTQGAGFVRRDPSNPHRFVFDNGMPYYPIGHNVAWANQNESVPDILTKMGAAGENWARIWMNHWDNKNLDWAMDAKNEPGTINLGVARKWDTIVDTAEKSGVYFQMTLQHHGQYSTTVNPNWGENPWNAKNGGFLATPEEFFTDPKAKALTKAKYRYIIARWGYSPSILAFELFNEVQFTDAIRNKHADTVLAWHKEMTAFLRSQDPYHHLVTTSSDTDIAGLYDGMDYVQPHTYPPDAIGTVEVLKPDDWDKPIFYGECGPGGAVTPTSAKSFLHSVLWASLMRPDLGGASQFWYWDRVDQQNLYGEYRAATQFLRTTNLESLPEMKSVSITVNTPESGSVVLSPSDGWNGKPVTSPIVVSPSGEAPGIALAVKYLQGKHHPDLFTGADFVVDYAQPGTFVVGIQQSAKAGAHVLITVDGKTAAEQDFPAAADDSRANVSLTANVPAGKHTVRLSNTGQDWVVLSHITLAPYGSGVKALGKANGDHAAFWLYRSAPPSGGAGDGAPGTVTLPGLKPGSYKVRWWDTTEGKDISTQSATVAANGTLTVPMPALTGDVAAFVSPG